jgi:surface protein
MKKTLFLSTLIAAVLLASSCQKEQELVTLGAVISQPGKTYIDDRYPCWNNGDQVYVNNATYPISAASGSSAQIADVVGADSYRAIFPASLVPANMDITNNGSIPVTLPATQVYTLVEGHQRVNAPMGAYTDGEVLQFHNLCSIVHVVVNNNTGSDMALDKLRIATDNAYLSGTGTATVTGADNDGITLSSDASHSVSLRIAGPTSVTLAAGAQSSFDIYVPAFPTDNVTITLYTTDGYSFELTKNGVALTPNTYTTVTLNVTSLTQILAAEMVDGLTFRNAIPDNATSVVFEYNSSVSSGTLLSTSNSPAPIYGNLNGTTWKVSTSASMINANPDCSWMFENKDNLYLIDFGDGFNTYNVTNMRGLFQACGNLSNLDLFNFNTENVTDMGFMFMYCFELTSLNLSNFNTENVKSMDYMFTRCSTLTNLDISKFNTEHVTSMNSMFKNCSSLTSLDLSNFNTENVTDMGAMFEACCNLEYLDVSSFNTENVTCMNSMFALGKEEADKDFVGTKIESNLQILDLSNFNTSNVTDMRFMFSGCGKLISLDLSNFDMSNITIIETTNEYYYEWMCYDLSTTSGHCTITCSLSVENAIKEIDPIYNPDREWDYSHSNYYISGLPTSGVTFTWVRPTSK